MVSGPLPTYATKVATRPRPYVWEFKGPTEIVGTLARVSPICALPSGGRGNHGNRGSIKEANGVTEQMRKDLSMVRWRKGLQGMERVLCEAMVPGLTKCLGENHPSTDESLW